MLEGKKEKGRDKKAKGTRRTTQERREKG